MKIINRIFVFILCGFLFFSSCKEEDISVINYQTVMSNIESSCNNVPSLYYFKCLLDNDSLCYHNDEDDYVMVTQIVTSFETESRTIQSDIVYDDAINWIQFGFYQPNATSFLEHFFIETPSTPFEEFGTPETPVDQIFESFLAVGSLPIRGIDDEDGLEIKIIIPYFTNSAYTSYSSYEKRTSFGNQEGSSLFVKSMEKTETENSFDYDIIAILNCKLYNPIHSPVDDGGEIFAEISNGELRFRVSLLKN